MISPTGKGTRSDSAGDGNYGANRGERKHNGVDYLCDEGQEVVAPFAMKVTRMAYPSRDMQMEGIAWSAGKSSGKMFYFKPDRALLGKEVAEGQAIGTAQAVSGYYGMDSMEDHIHFQIDK